MLVLTRCEPDLPDTVPEEVYRELQKQSDELYEWPKERRPIPRRRPHPDLVFGLHLGKEIDTATQLLAVGLNQTIEPSWHASEPSAAFTCMSSGVERLLKLTYCLALVHEGRTFPSDKDLRALGHDLVALDNVVRPPLLNGARTLAKNYVANSLTQLDEDAYWSDLLTALNV